MTIALGNLRHNRMDFPQEMGTQDDKMKADFYFDTPSQNLFKKLV